jgi:hypothetical protein
VYLDPDVLRATRVLAARTGRKDSEVVEEALRRYLAIGVLERIWSHSPSDLTDEDALELANAELHAQRSGS